MEDHTWVNFKSLSALSEEGALFDKNTNKVFIFIIISDFRHLLQLLFMFWLYSS